jgi:hypothetical protein
MKDNQLTPEYLAGTQAERDGIKWWNNPYPSGGVASYEWDKGHTGARRLRAAMK